MQKETTWLSPEEVAQKLGVTLVTVYRYFTQETNKLPSYKVSNSTVRVDSGELDQWIRQNKRGELISKPFVPKIDWTESEKGGPTYE